MRYRQNRNPSVFQKDMEELFDYTVEQTRSITAIFSAEDYSVLYISDNAEELLGVEKKDYLGNIINLLEMGTRDNRPEIPADIFLDRLNPGDSVEADVIRWTNPKTGEKKFLQGHIKRNIIEGEDIFFIVVTDKTDEVSRRHQMQEMIDVANAANQAKTNFLANMSHDFRTPMNAITNFNLLIAKNSENPQKVRDYTHKIELSCESLLGLLNDVLDMSKIESGKAKLNNEEFALGLLLEEVNSVVAFQAKGKKQEYCVHAGGMQQDLFKGDKQRINEILVNILGNAVKYTPEGGRIDFTITEEKALTTGYWDVKFEIKDNGIGMSKSFQETIFEAFTREDKASTRGIQGTGLGMAITKSLVEMMGGTISVDAEEGKGSVFVVKLRLPGLSQDQGKFWSEHGIRRILVIDDDLKECEKIEMALHDTDVEVFFSTSGYRALHLVDVSDEDEKGFDVILLGMKVLRLDCFEVAERIRFKKFRRQPIILLLTEEWEEIAEKARESGITDFLTKPFFMSTFQQIITDIVNRNLQAMQERENSIMGMRFLAAEDNDINADILTELMAMEGAIVVRAKDGAEAVEMFEKAEPGSFDMILMDIQMPVMNGYQAAEAIRKLEKEDAKDIPIIAMTANAYADDVQKAVKSGMNAHVSKPIDMRVLEDTIGGLKVNNEST